MAWFDLLVRHLRMPRGAWWVGVVIRHAVLWFLVVMSSWASAEAQWQRVTPSFLGHHDKYNWPGSGAIETRDGAVWAADSVLWYSVDSGQSWMEGDFRAADWVNPYDNHSYWNGVTDLKFFDNKYGVLASDGPSAMRAVYFTTDGGASWRERLSDTALPSGIPISIAFGPTKNDVVFCDGVPPVTTTHDGGQTILHSQINAFALASNGQNFFATGDYGEFWYSGDNGNKWALRNPSITPDQTCADTYSIALDSCDLDRIVLANEVYYGADKLHGDTACHILMSKDGGTTWYAAFTGNFGYLVGAVARGPRAIFVATRYNGILRSLDFGQTWQSIGGPNAYWDSRSICAVSDNLLFAIDTDGSIWRTTNSGGSWVPDNVSPGYTFDPPALFMQDTATTCDTALSQVSRFAIAKCDDFAVTSQTIAGPDQKYFTIVSGLPAALTGYDSVTIAFHPDAERTYSATYTAVINGVEHKIALGGTGRTHKVTAMTVTLVDSASACETSTNVIQLDARLCAPLRLTSLRIVGPDSMHFAAIDSLPSDLTASDSIAIAFSADSSRLYTAEVILDFGDGEEQVVPVRGFASTPAIRVALGSTYLTTQFVGDDIDVPVLLSTADPTTSASLELRFDTSVLAYQSSANASGSVIASRMAGKGMVKLDLAGADFASGAAHVHFRYFPTSDSCSTVQLDSVKLMGATDCPLSIGSPFVAEVCGPGGCDIGLLSNFMRSGAIPEFSISPNPATHEIVIALSDKPSAALTLTIFDALGSERYSRTLTDQSSRLDVSELGSGVYYVRVTDGASVRTKRVVVAR